MRKLVYSLIIVGLTATPLVALAQITPEQTGLQRTAAEAGYGEETPSLALVIAGIINVVLGLIGLILVVLLIYGGVLWMTAQGNTEQIKKAKAVLINSIIGIIIIVASYAIASYVLSALVGTVADGGAVIQ